MASFAARVVVSVALAVAAGAGSPAAAQEGTPKAGAIAGVVLDAGGTPCPAAIVRLRNGHAADRVQVTDGKGAYIFSEVPPGRYTIDVLADGLQIAAAPRPVSVEPGQQVAQHILIGLRSSRHGTLMLVLTILSALSYLAVMYLFRHHGIAEHARSVLRAQIDSVAARLQLEAQDRPEIERLSAELRNLKDEARRQVSWREWFFWTGREFTGWTRIHEVERQLAAYLVPPARVFERAHTAEAELRSCATREATVLADRMRATVGEFSRLPDNGGGASNRGRAAALLEQLKQQLAEALAIIYDERDCKFASLMEWQNKAMWIVHVAVIAIILLASTFNHEHLFLFGAIGGLLSRMARVVFQKNVPTDYGDSWTTLFLSPLAGAISAWFGIALIIFLTDFGVLGAALARVSWTAPVGDPTVMALAVVLGFSERLFTTLLQATDERLQSQLQGEPEKPAVPAAVQATAREATMLAETAAGHPA